MFQHVPVLPVVIPLGVAVLVGLLRGLRRSGRSNPERVSVAVALSVYAAGVIANTVFPIYLGKPVQDGAWSDGLAVVPLLHYEVGDAVMNVVVFAPLGLLLGLVLTRPRWYWVLAVAAAASLGIEVLQYLSAQLLGAGHIADVNDFLFNLIGAAIGVTVLQVLGRVPLLAPLVERLRWH